MLTVDTDFCHRGSILRRCSLASRLSRLPEIDTYEWTFFPEHGVRHPLFLLASILVISIGCGRKVHGHASEMDQSPTVGCWASEGWIVCCGESCCRINVMQPMHCCTKIGDSASWDCILYKSSWSLRLTIPAHAPPADTVSFPTGTLHIPPTT
jgi:hypothetical protein